MYRLNSPLAPPQQKQTIDASLAIVNIVLLLIFFFLATGTILSSDSIQGTLPETQELPLERLPKPLLQISEDGGMLLDGEAVAPGSLADATSQLFVLNVLADQEANALKIMQVLAAENLIAIEIRLVTVHVTRGKGE